MADEPLLSRLIVRLLGGFDVRLGSEAVAGFESQKVRAIFAYLVLHRQQLLSRDHLATLMWPERDEESARRNLRQALYNLRSVLPGGEPGPDLLLASHQSIALNPAIDCWVDVEAFQQAVRSGLSERGSDPHQLAIAARLYTGEFLAGFNIRGHTGFEEWLVGQQERLRESAVEVLRELVEGYLARGELRVGIEYALRLVSIDPLSEEAHCLLMRLFALSGRRGRALAQYEELKAQLAGELGVEPLEETTGLREAILRDELPARPARADDRPLAPFIPLLERGDAYAALEACWREVCAGRSRLTLVLGEAGVGKTRLVGSFIDSVTSQLDVTVLRASCHREVPLVSHDLLRQGLGPVLGALPGLLDQVLEAVPHPRRELLASVLLGAPEAARTASRPVERGEAGRDELFAAVGALLVALTRHPAGAERPVIFFIDALEWSDPPSQQLLRHLSEQPLAAPVWFLATCRSPSPEGARCRLGSGTGGIAGDDRLQLQRLSPTAVGELAAGLVPDDAARQLETLLARRGEGWPLAMAQIVNHLWDEGALRPHATLAGRWRLDQGTFKARAAELPAELDELILLRVQRLPSSVRRLAVLAAVIGTHFDAELLARAGEEHAGVVEIALELLLERWLIRQSMASWAQGRRHSDLELWASGARQGAFEFAHEAIRGAILRHLAPARRRFLHRRVAATLEEMFRESPERACEALAFHHLSAADPDRALPYLRRAAERARLLLAEENAETYRELAMRQAQQIDAAAAVDPAAARGARLGAPPSPTAERRRPN